MTKFALKSALACTVSLFAIGGTAYAADPAPTNVGEVVVTGSRIPTNGNNQPTPVTVVSAQQLQASTPSSLPDALNKLPAFNTASTPNNAATGANGRGYNTPGNFLNLRNLGAIRTLILEDGRRVPGTFYDTTVDTDMLPQLLVQRVEVVTGGASAVYGSDAVSGVVNFIIDHKFVGLKGLVQGGISTYGDAPSERIGIANGMNVGERGHFEWSAEYYNRDAITSQADRPYGPLGSSVVGAGTAANPYRLIYNARQSNAPYGGLVTSGPFAGMQFLNNGTLAPYNAGTPTQTSNIAIGGDGGTQTTGYLIPSRRTAQVYGRYDYDLNNDTHAFVEARWAKAHSYESNQAFTNTPNGYPLYIYSDNAFLSPALRNQLATAGVTSFGLNRFDQDIAQGLALDTNVQAWAVTAGLNGRLFGDFKWDGYYTHGETTTRLATLNNVNSARFYAAADAVIDPASGQPVCRVALTAPGAFPGCAPLDLFGSGNMSQAALNYIRGTTEWEAHNGLDDFGLNLAGTAFEGWAGPVKLAVGGEYRHATLLVTTSVPSTAFNPTGLRLGPNGTSTPGSYPASNLAWFKEVQSGANGGEDVSEGNVEVDAPMLRNLPLIQLLSLNGAYRYTQYSTNGNGNESSKFSANTWKVGLEWQLTDDIRLRATRSRDMRAPTLWDLYQRQIISSSNISDPLTGVAGSANTLAGGNPNLRPEIAHNTTAGIVYHPSWAPNFNIAVDYYHIEIDNAIGSVNGLNPIIQNLCFAQGASSFYCGLVQRPISYNSTSPGNFPTLIYNLAENIAKTYAEGVDVEVNYQKDLADVFDFGGIVSTRLLWNHQPTLKTQNLPKTLTTNAAGTSVSPTDKVNFTINYVRGPFSATVMQRYYSSFRQSANPTLVFAYGDVSAYSQTDLNLSYDFISDGRKLTAFLNINNLFNAEGGLYQVPAYTGSPGMNYPVGTGADLIGRYFTLGVRFAM